MNIDLGNFIKLKLINRGFILALRTETFKIKKYINPIDFQEYKGLVANYKCYHFRYRNIKPKWIFMKSKIDLAHSKFLKEMAEMQIKNITITTTNE